MKYISFILVLFAIRSLTMVAICQESGVDTLISFTGRILQSDNNKGVAFVNVINVNRHRGTMSDTIGYFHIFCKQTDTIRISSIGYLNRQICLKDSNVIDHGFFTKIAIQKHVYQLPSVNINAITWEGFKKAIIEMDMVEPDKPGGTDWYENLFRPGDLESIINQPKTGISFQLKSKEDKSRELVLKIKKEEDLNKKLVKLAYNTTRLSGTQLYKFIGFCNINKIILEKSTDYEIMVRLKRCYSNYRRRHKTRRR